MLNDFDIVLLLPPFAKNLLRRAHCFLCEMLFKRVSLCFVRRGLVSLGLQRSMTVRKTCWPG